MDMAFSRARMDDRCESGLNFWRVPAGLRKKLGFVVRNRVLAILNRWVDGVGRVR